MEQHLFMSKKEEIVGDSVITPSTGRGFASGFFLGHLWDVLLRRRSSRRTASFRHVARDGAAVGMSSGKASSEGNGLTTSLVLRLPMTESRTFLNELLPLGLS